MATEPATKPRGRSHVTKLINLVMASGAELFRTPEGDLYVTVPNGDHKDTLPLVSRTMKEWMARAYFMTTKSGVSSGALSDAIAALAGSARAQGIEHRVYARVAAVGACVYLDLCRPDHQILRIDAGGWALTAAPADIRFVRPRGMLPLPLPVPDPAGRGLADMLATVINVPAFGSTDSTTHNSADMMMLIGWLVGALRGLKPYPVLSIVGEYGTAKSYVSRLVRRVIDPNIADLSSAPKEPRDLMVSAQHAHVLAFDNLSKIPGWFSDLLCCLATGAGFRARALFTDADEVIFSAARPCIVNGITDMIQRGDLMDRTLALTLAPIAEKDRRTEADVDAAFAQAQPGILAALADAVSQALRAPVTLTRLPRMADFAATVESAAPALGWAPEAFLDTYQQRRQTADEVILDADLVAVALSALRPGDGLGSTWAGTSEELRDALESLTPERKRDKLPRSGKGLIAALRRLAPSLRATGIDVQLPTGPETSGERRGQRLITIAWTGGQSSVRTDDEDISGTGVDVDF